MGRSQADGKDRDFPSYTLPRNRSHDVSTSSAEWGPFLMRVPAYLNHIFWEWGFHIVYIIALTDISHQIQLLPKKIRAPPHLDQIAPPLPRPPPADRQGTGRAGLAGSPHSHNCEEALTHSFLHTQFLLLEKLSPFFLYLSSFWGNWNYLLSTLSMAEHDSPPSALGSAQTPVYGHLSTAPAFPGPQPNQGKQFTLSPSLSVHNKHATWWVSSLGEGEGCVVRDEGHRKEEGGGREDKWPEAVWAQDGDTREFHCLRKGQTSDFSSDH